MRLTDSKKLHAVEHWNRALAAEDAEDYETAIKEYDDCLCSSPDAAMALEAFYRLGFAIHEEHDLADRNLDDEQRAWLCCKLASFERVSEIYETRREWPADDKQEDPRLIYSDTQAVLNAQESVGATSEWQRRANINVAETLGLLRCFSESVSFYFDSNGDPLSAAAIPLTSSGTEGPEFNAERPNESGNLTLGGTKQD